jgi:hypothetical protein
LAQQVLDEYDTNHVGFLSQKEFMVLADLIMRNYEALVRTSENKKVCSHARAAIACCKEAQRNAELR